MSKKRLNHGEGNSICKNVWFCIQFFMIVSNYLNFTSILGEEDFLVGQWPDGFVHSVYW